MAIQLKEAGFSDITVFEKANDVGGCWRENTYPGAACDVPSHLYSYSFELKSDWSRRFAEQEEILTYIRHCAEKYQVWSHIRFNTEVNAAEFDDDSGQWTLTLSDGNTAVADVVIPACGQLSRPAYPRIEGLDDFQGEIFHSATWNHDYNLDGKKVAVIGTGASAIQFVPRIAPVVNKLTLFQRSAPHVIPKSDYAYPKRVQALFSRFPSTLRASRWATYCELEPRALMFTKFPQISTLYEKVFLRNLRKCVADPVLREKLTPKDPIGCKRVLLSNDYYPALTRDNVHVETEDISRVTASGIDTVDGTTHQVDAIILGTGFTATDFLAPMRISGRGGKSLNDEWRAGAEAYLGITVSGFPNMFMLYGPNTNLGHNSIILMLESQMRYVLEAVKKLHDNSLRWIDVRDAAQGNFNDEIHKRVSATIWDRECSSWYKTAAGKNTNNWPGFTFTYNALTRSVNLDDYDTTQLVS
ncbi:flavin-binding monooxygenase [Hoyosella rhizosphaerae]|uniref:Flavin-binding monooxygenase n=2 Tax=Hoyosella rhizosphaerae TaxID=1755582 RepID=A0A916U7V7_9ACTN|nr:flavin-binding monooxygenase [Hoyosella rhizosphaerae]